MIRSTTYALLSHWRRKPFQFLTLVVSLALATALWSGVQAINAEARASYGEAADVLNGAPELIHSEGSTITVADFAKLRRNGWLVSPVIDGTLPTQNGSVQVLGIDAFTQPGPPDATFPDGLEFGELTGQSGLLFASRETKALLPELDGRVRVSESIAPNLVVGDVTAVQSLLGADGYSRLILLPDQPLRQPLLSDVAPQLRMRQPQSSEDLSRLTDSFHLNLTAFGLLSFAVGLFIVNGAVGLAFEQRRPVFRTLRALGLTAGQLVLVLLIELLFIAIVAGVLGVLLGYLLAAALLPDVAATLRGLYGASVDGTLTLAPSWWISGLIIAVLGTAVASCGSLIKVARLSPLAAAQPRAWLRASDQTTIAQLFGATCCLIFAILSWQFADGLISGFMLLGGLLLAAALCLPAMLSVFLAAVSKLASGVLSEWFWSDTRQQLPGLSLALMALLLALAANIGVSTMVGSFRQTFTGWLDQRLASELYVTIENADDIERFQEFVEPYVDAVLPIWHTDANVLDAPAEIYGVIDHATYRENWPMLEASENVWDRLANGQGLLINEQLARRGDLWPGDQLRLSDEWSVEILGVYSDYGNPLGQVILPLDVLIERYRTIDRTDFGLRLAPENLQIARDALTQDFGLPPRNLIDQSALKRFSLAIFERTFAVTSALNILTLAIAGFAILTSLLTLSAMRLPQLAPVWAIGLPRHTLSRIEVLRTVMLAALTFVIAIPVGLVLAWVLLSVINVEAFGWKLPMHIFPRDWLILGALSLLAGLFASLWPARRLSRSPPSELIRIFANER